MKQIPFHFMKNIDFKMFTADLNCAHNIQRTNNNKLFEEESLMTRNDSPEL